MKNFYYLLLTLFASCFYNAQDAGIFESYAVLNINNGGNTFYDLQANTGNVDFNNLDLGSFNSATQSIMFSGGEMKTWKNNGADVTGGKIFFRIYSGTPSGSFSEVPFGFIENLSNPGDQKWGSVSGNNNILTGLGIGTYTLEVYVEAYTNVGTKYSANGGVNYKATFSVTNNLSIKDANRLNFKSFVSDGKLYTSQKGKLKIQVYDLGGKMIKELNVDNSVNGIELNLRQKGFYLVKINNEAVKIVY